VQPRRGYVTKSFGGNLITGLMRVVESMLNIYNVPEKNLVSFPFHEY
jgi:hypothetical protein